MLLHEALPLQLLPPPLVLVADLLQVPPGQDWLAQPAANKAAAAAAKITPLPKLFINLSPYRGLFAHENMVYTPSR